MNTIRNTIAIVVLFTTAACNSSIEVSNNNDNQDIKIESLTARIAQTRTAFNATGVFSWSDHDDIAVHRNVDGYESVPLNSDGCFNVHLTGLDFRDGFALYPARIANETAFSAGDLKVTLPTHYSIPFSGMGEEAPMPMVAVNDKTEEDLVFHHLGGLIQLSLNGVPYETAILSVNFGKRITGDFVVNDPESAYPSIVSDDQEGEGTIFSLSKPLSAPTDGYILNIPVPVGTYESLTVVAKDFKGNILAEGSDMTSRSVDRAEGLHSSMSLSMETDKIPLAIKALRSQTVTISNPLGLHIEYSYNNSDWESSESTEIILNLEHGESLFLRGDNPHYATGSIDASSYSVQLSSYTNIRCTADVYVYGNIMSLISSDHFSSETSLSDDYALAGLFKDNTFIKNHPSLPLHLPATGLSPSCYARLFEGCTGIVSPPIMPDSDIEPFCFNQMFSGCTHLTQAPVMPSAGTVKEGCFTGMFKNCKALTVAPSLGATVIAEGCYKDMFQGSGIIQPPAELPATTMKKSCYSTMFSGTPITSAPILNGIDLATDCYWGMFQSCSNLLAAPALNAENMATRCYFRMFEGCKALVNAPALQSQNLSNACYGYMFNNCTNLVSVPDLPASELEDFCYEYMFNGCTSLTSAQNELPALTAKPSCYLHMFDGCTSLTSSPLIKLTSLALNCCQLMFNGCSSLSTVKAMFLDAPGNNYTLNWLQGVSSTGTFYKNPAATWDTDPGFTRSITTVPTGWTITNAGE